MLRRTMALGGLMMFAASCSRQPAEPPAHPPAAVTLYEGARLIAGDGSAPTESSAFLVEDGTMTRVGSKGEIEAPAGAARVDLTGTTVMPTLVDAHGHPGFQNGLSYTADNLTRENIVNDLNRALYFGVGVIQSLGIEKGDTMDQIRADQKAGTLGGARLLIAGRGMGAPNAGPGSAAYANIVYELTTEDEARQAVRELAAKKVDMLKIWVDDRNGRAPRLPPNLYRVIIDEGHKAGLRVTAHVYYHEDAVDLVNSGINGFAHNVRDKVLSDELVAAIVENHVYVMLNMSERSTYRELPPWLKDGDPLMAMIQESVPAPVIERIKKSYEGRDPAAVDRARASYAILQQSAAKLAKAGAHIILGPDTGLVDHLFGIAEQREMDNMVAAGLTPMQAIVAATSRTAEFLKLDTLGRLAPGMEASFLVLDANPLDRITNIARISRIYVRGVEVDRAALARSLRMPASATN